MPTLLQTNTKEKIQNQFPPETAGRLMVTNVPVVRDNSSVLTVDKMLKKQSLDFETINYVYVVNGHYKLVGVFSVKELYRAPKSRNVKDLMTTELVTARSHTDQERVVLVALKHNIKAVPVVEKNGKFLGAVTSDVILNVLHSESIEDALRFAGAGKIDNPAVNLIKAGALFHVKKRLPWLFLGLLGGIGAAFVVKFFESALEEEIILAAFIPAIVYMSDAVGSQTQTIFIRSMALTHALDIKKYIWRELRVTISLAAVLGTVVYFFGHFWLGSSALGVVFGSAITVTILAAMVVAIALPLILLRFNYDPAIASGPFATVTRDITSLLIYFGIASLLL